MRLVSAVLLVFASLSSVAATIVHGQTVTADRGSVCLRRSPNSPCQLLTHTGLDREPDLSADGKEVVFVRGTPHDSVEGPTGPEEATELWIVDVATGETRRLLRGGALTNSNGVPVAHFTSPQFSPTGRIYILSMAAVVSDVVYSLDPTTGTAQQVCAGNSLRVVKRGSYAGALLVEQHRYFVGGGSYDWVYLIGPDGKEIGTLGDQSEPGFANRLAEVLGADP